MTTKIFNPQSKNLIVLSVKLRRTFETIKYLFPLNPASLTITQASRVSATFTYGAKVFQNLGAGLKNISIEGHTGYRLDARKYGIQKSASELALNAALELSPSPGKLLWLDLYALVQLVKGENKYLPKYSTVKDNFSVDNIDLIDTVQLTIPDQGITYDVLLQNDSFMRNREQPNLYKYKLDFIITQESLGTPSAVLALADNIPDPGGLTASIKRQANLLKNIKKSFMSYTGIQTIADIYDNAVKYVNESVEYGNLFINAANSTINDLRRLEKMSDALNGITKNLGLVRLAVNQIKSFANLKTAFYEPYIRLKNISMQMSLLKKAMIGEQQNLQFNVNLTRLASVSAPVTLAANKATAAQFQKDIRQINRISFPFPVDRVEEKLSNDVLKINIFFKDRPSALGISDIKIFAINDFGNENNLVESITDSQLIMSTNYDESGYLYNFLIEYNYSSFESMTQSKYKSIKKILIRNGDTIDSIIKRYCPNEANSSKSYLSEIAYLNNIEFPYIVTSDNLNHEAYFGSYGYKIFSTNGEFLQYIYNINFGIYPGPDFILFDSSVVDSTTNFYLQQQEVIDQIKTGSKFFVVLFKETYSNRCYAVFGIINDSSKTTSKFFSADSYVICSLEKGRSYDIDNDSLFEILSPYTCAGDLIDYYGQTMLFESIIDPSIALFDKLLTVIEQIYIQNIGSFTASTYPFTEADKIFLSGNEFNENYVVLTNFKIDHGITSSYAINAFSSYRILTDGQEILLPSLENTFLPFAQAFTLEDTYKVDLDARFQYLDDIHVSILPRSDLGSNSGILDFKLICGIDNVKQAIKNRLECPQGGLILHNDYGLPVLLGKKNTLEQLILLRYNLFSQLMSDKRVNSSNNIEVQTLEGDAINAQASIVLINNDNVLIKTTL